MEGFCLSLENTKNRCRKYCFVPQRYLLALMGALGIMCALLMRSSVYVIMYYTIESKDRVKTQHSKVCTNNLTSEFEPNVSPNIEFADRYSWDDDDLGQIEEIFFYGYFLGHLPGGYLGDMYGGKHVFGASILLSAFITAITPLVIKQTRSATSVVFLRFLGGVIQGALYPALNSLISCWTPTRDRGRISGIVFSADVFSTVVNNVLLSTEFKGMADWSYIFYLYSAVSVLWWIFWNLLCYSYPTRCPFLGEKEKDYLEKELEGHVIYGKKKVPFFRILASTPLWMLVFIEIASDWIFFSMIDDLPQYLNTVLNYRFDHHRLIATVPNTICGVACIFNGILADYILNMHWLSVTTLRQIFVTIGVMGPPIFIVAATFGGCNARLAMLMFTIGFTLMGGFYTGGRIVTLDLAPNYSGIVMGIVNGIGTLSGAIPPRIENLILEKKNIFEWRMVFSVSLVISGISNLFFSIWGTGKEQAWNNPDSKVVKEEEEEDNDNDKEEEEEEKEEDIVKPYT